MSASDERYLRGQHQPFPVQTRVGLALVIAVVAVIGLVYYLVTRHIEPSPRDLANMNGNETAVDVEDLVGTDSAAGARPAVDVLTDASAVVGETVKVKGEVASVLSPTAFFLDRDPDISGDEILVLNQRGAYGPRGIEAGDDAIVEGRVVRFGEAQHPALRDEGLSDLQIADLDGEVGLLVPDKEALAH